MSDKGVFRRGGGDRFPVKGRKSRKHIEELLLALSLVEDVEEEEDDAYISGSESPQNDGEETKVNSSSSDVDSGISTNENSDDEPELDGQCPQDCFCRRLRHWLLEQGDRERDILDDVYYRESGLWVKSKDLLPDHSRCNYDPYPSLDKESFRFSGDRDRWGRPHGRGRAYFPNGRKFMGSFNRGQRSGAGELFEREGARILCGNYESDQLQGVCEISTSEGGSLEMTFEKGVAHGPARRFSPDGDLQWVGRYRFGTPFGRCWKSNDTEGWLYGAVNAAGRMTGDDVVYLYPDLHTALVGKWQNDCLVRARLTQVVGVMVLDGLLAPELEENIDEQCFKADLSGFSVISSQPMLRDPYEDELVECKISTLPAGGQGLYLKRDVPMGRVVAFYNGVRFHDCHAYNDWSQNSYKIRLNEKRKQILDIPVASRDLKRYCATLAHKVNHSFFPNSRFCDFSHPRFGRILCVKTNRALRKGDEIFCNYGYNLADCPAWFKELHDSLFHENGEPKQQTPITLTIPRRKSSVRKRRHSKK